MERLKVEHREHVREKEALDKEVTSMVHTEATRNHTIYILPDC